jgi:DNA-binding CsgD family transcriptional regulator
MTTHYLSLFDYLENIHSTDINFDDYCHIPSVKYRNHIADFCKDLSKIKDITGYGCTLMLPNGMMCFISNKPFMHIAYASSGIERANSYFIKAYNFPETHFFFTKNKEQKIDLLEKAMTQFLEEKFKIYNTYCLKRKINKKPEKLLTQRETECVHWASRGKTIAEIAILMQISELTVTEHKKSIMQKLYACNMTHAVREAIHAGIIA